jgi:hypothetical protein
MELGICAGLTLPRKSSLKPEEENDRILKSACPEERTLKNSSWSKLLAKIFQIGVT